VKNFILGLLLGSLATYAYFTQGEYVRSVVWELWARASAPPPLTRPER